MAAYYKYKGCSIPIMDLISEGTIGLIESIKKFDITKQCRLATYAVHHIKARMYSFIMDSFSMVKLGSSKVTKALFGKYKELMGADDEKISQIAEEVNASEAKVLSMKNRLSSLDYSLDTEVFEDSSTTFANKLMCKNSNPEELILDQDSRIKYLTAIRLACDKVLNEEEKEIIYHRIISENPMKLKDLSVIQGISPEAVRQKQERALAKIRSYVEKVGLPCKNQSILNQLA
jgi:RNA polymerase sigma-32 factor